MVHYLLRRGRHRVTVPRGFGLWFVFLLFMLMSVVMIDSGGRMVGFVQRALSYGAVTVMFIYCYNARAQLTVDSLMRSLMWFWVTMVTGGFIGLILPSLTITTPVAWIMPQSLLNNELVAEMAYRRFTQYNPTGYLQISPRPSMPYLYTNGWGLGYALLTPMVIMYRQRVGRVLRIFLSIMLPLSFIPAGLSLNRGMFVGLGVAALAVGLWSLYQRQFRVTFALLGLGLVGLLAVTVLPILDRLEHRLGVSSTTEDRFALYVEAIQRTTQSPILGFGAPRPSVMPGIPSVGTQGQFWMVMFSHGFIALTAFVLTLVWMAATSLKQAIRSRDLLLFTFAIVPLNALVAMLFYSLLNTNIMIVFACIALVLREHHART